MTLRLCGKANRRDAKLLELLAEAVAVLAGDDE